MTNNEYFEWLCDLVCKGRYSGSISYTKLLYRLYTTEFIYLVPMDQNRAEDGLDLRSKFGISRHGSPCSVLEMLIALSIRCEDDIMDDFSYGDRRAQWFWMMITNLGLGAMYDHNYDQKHVDSVLSVFINRRYAPDGTGGLFPIRGCEYDMRDVEIWVQLSWYLSATT